MAREQRIRSFSQSANQVVALDVGSSFTRAKIGDKIVFDEPTCLAIRRGGDTVVAIGKKAYQLLGKNSSQIEVLFPVQYGAPASATYFNFFMQAVSTKLNIKQSWLAQFSGNEVVVGMPDSLSSIEKDQFLKGIKSTHVGKVTPISAALAAAHHLKRDDTSGVPLCLVHIGGQTTQISIISAGEVISAAKFQWGGVLFTEIVQETVRNREQCGISWHVAEMIKKEIAFIDSQILARSAKNKKMSVQGKDITTQLGKTVIVASEDFLPSFEVLLSDLLINLKLFFAQLPTEIATTAMASGLVMTGGGSMLVGLAEYLSGQLQTEVFVSPTPEYDVVKGLMAV